MGIVRRHPFLTLVVVVASVPVFLLIAFEAAQHTPACREWRQKIDAAMFHGKLSPWDDYHRGTMSVDEYRGNVRDQLAHDMRESRPPFCE